MVYYNLLSTLKELAQALLINKVGEHCQHVNGNTLTTVQKRMLAEILIHLSVIQAHVPNTNLMLPLVTLMTAPQTMKVLSHKILLRAVPLISILAGGGAGQARPEPK